MASDRAGRMIRQRIGNAAYSAFIPKPLPPEPALLIDAEMADLLAKANLAVGRLDGATEQLPNPDLFVYMYVRREAVLSSQIEGTQSTLEDILEYEAGDRSGDLPDIVEVVNYVKAMNYGLERLDTIPLSKRLIKEIHGILLGEGNVRGAHATPGEFRRSQNWIGPRGCTLSTATFVPPPHLEMEQAMNDLEMYLHAGDYPDLIHTGLVHAQFETIHPFLDGNGRVGRLLITFLICHRGVLKKPLLYLSYFFRLNRSEYYRELNSVRKDGAWESWLKFFLRGVTTVAEEAATISRKIVAMRDEHMKLMSADGGKYGAASIEVVFEHPIFTVNLLADRLDITFATANKLAKRMQELGIAEELTGKKRDRRYRYTPYLTLFSDSPLVPAGGDRG